MSHVNISLGCNTAAYIQRLKDARTQTDRNIILMEKRVDEFAKSVNDNFTDVNSAINVMMGGLSKMKGGGYIAAAGALGFAVSSVAMQMHQLGLNTIEAEKMLTRAADQAGLTADEMRTLSAVTKTVGIDLEKMGDISKDLQDKMGDYQTAKAGGFVDFFDVVGNKTDITIEKLQKLSSPEVLKAVVAEMEKVGASGAQMTFVLESIANDSSYLLPLLRDGAKGFEDLHKRMEEVSNTPLLLSDTADDVKVLDTAFNSMWDSFGVLMTEKFNTFTELMTDAAKQANDFFNESTLASQSEKMMKSVNDGTHKINANESVDQLQQQRDALAYGRDNLKPNDDGYQMKRKALEEEKGFLLGRSDEELDAAIAELDKAQQEKLAQRENKLNAILAEYDAAIAKAKEDSNAGGTGTGSGGKDPDSKPPSIVGELAEGKAGVDLANNEEEKLEAQYQLRLLEISQLQVHEDTKAQLILKAAADRDKALDKLEADRANKRRAELDKELQERHNHEMMLAQLKIDSAITEDERLTAQHEMELLKIQHQGQLSAEAKAASNDLIFNADYEHIQNKAELDTQSFTNEHERQIEQAQISLDWLNEQRELNRISEEEHDTLSLEHKKSIADAKAQILQSELDLIAGSLAGISNLAERGSKEQKALFAVEKAAAIASLSVEQWEAWGKAGTWGEKAAVIAAYAGALTSVASVSMGQFHSGTDEVDQTGSYILKAGERVVQETANKDLTSFLKSNKDAGGNTQTINAPLTIQGGSGANDEEFDAMLYKHRENLLSAIRAAQRETP